VLCAKPNGRRVERLNHLLLLPERMQFGSACLFPWRFSEFGHVDVFWELVLFLACSAPSWHDTAGQSKHSAVPTLDFPGTEHTVCSCSLGIKHFHSFLLTGGLWLIVTCSDWDKKLSTAMRSDVLHEVIVPELRASAGCPCPAAQGRAPARLPWCGGQCPCGGIASRCKSGKPPGVAARNTALSVTDWKQGLQ